ncbi:MAG: OmpH family outer membrane protein [Candidatus Aminicenantes bacterium]|nr:OmpH family outer membrane protein [Candidatus Aminicenantes bacterium]
MKKKIFFVIALCFGFILASLSTAQAQNKIGVVNSQDVLEKSIEGKRVLSQLADQDKKNQDQLAKLDEEIRKLETRLNTQRMTLSDEALMQLNSDLTRKRTERTRLSEDMARDMQELQFRLYSRLQNELIPIIEQIGKEKGFDIIFDLRNSGAVYVNPAIDITEEVIKRYDAVKTKK